jgi:hypothetical protein
MDFIGYVKGEWFTYCKDLTIALFLGYPDISG